MLLKTSDSIKVTSASQLLAFSFAKSNADTEMSLARTSQEGRSFFREMAIAPLPVPISKTEQSSTLFSDKIRSTNSSVSGLGIKTRSSTKKIRSLK